MKLTDFKKLAPATVPVASIPFRGGVLDLYPLRGEDIFWLVSQAGTVGRLFASDQGEGLLAAIAEAGPEFVRRIISVSTRATAADIEEMDLSAEEELDILLAALDSGIPEDLLGKLVAGLQTVLLRAGAQTPASLTAASAGFSSDSSQTASTPTPSRSSKPSSSARPSKKKSVRH